MKQFIEVNDTNDATKYYININRIVRVVSSSKSDWNGCCIVMVDSGKVFINESYDNVLKMIKRIEVSK